MTEYEALLKAVDVMGGQTALATALTKSMNRKERPIRQGHVWKWINNSKRLPELYAMHVEKLTRRKGQVVLARDLCPAAFSTNKAA